MDLRETVADPLLLSLICGVVHVSCIQVILVNLATFKVKENYPTISLNTNILFCISSVFVLQLSIFWEKSNLKSTHGFIIKYLLFLIIGKTVSCIRRLWGLELAGGCVMSTQLAGHGRLLSKFINHSIYHCVITIITASITHSRH